MNLKHIKFEKIINNTIKKGIDSISLDDWRIDIWSCEPDPECWSSYAVKCIWYLKTHQTANAQIILQSWRQNAWKENQRSIEMFQYLNAHLHLIMSYTLIDPCTRNLKLNLWRSSLSYLGGSYIASDAHDALEPMPSVKLNPYEVISQCFPNIYTEKDSSHINDLCKKDRNETTNFSKILINLSNHHYLENMGFTFNPIIDTAQETLVLIDADTLSDNDLSSLVNTLILLNKENRMDIYCARNKSFPDSIKKTVKCIEVPISTNAADDMLCSIGLKMLCKNSSRRLIVFTQDKDFSHMVTQWINFDLPTYLSPLRTDYVAINIIQHYQKIGAIILPPFFCWI